MISLIQRIIPGFVAPNHRLSCSPTRWREGLRELRSRTGGRHESGAFLLGKCERGRRRIKTFIYYDDLDPSCLDSGIVDFDGLGYAMLWRRCRESGLSVVADIHVHPGRPNQSLSDRNNPMIAQRGHIALIVPLLANRIFGPKELGIYEYEGEHRWRDRSGKDATAFFYLGCWG